jgi:hypothetical protein
MATTTPNFGWSVPTSSDLVKNGATAIETLGDSIDASMAELLGGTTGQVLSKTTATNMDFTWATPGGMTLINTGGTALSGASVTVSSIPSTYTNLLIVLSNYYTATADSATQIYFNGDTGANYTYSRIRNINATLNGASGLNTTYAEINTRSIATNTSGKTANSQVTIYRYTDTTANKFFDYTSSAVESTNNVANVTGAANYKGTSAISSITVYADSNFSGGTIYVYGVK